jgi:signal transduction histidine kinase
VQGVIAWTADAALGLTSVSGGDLSIAEAIASATLDHQRAALGGERRACRHVAGERVFDVQVGPAYAPDGEIAGVTGIAVDVTRSVGLAHDFSNMLTVIRGYSEAVAGALGPDHPAAADLEEVDRAASHAGGLVRRLLAFARREEIAREPRSLNEIVREAAALLAPLAGPRIAIETALDPRAGAVRADPASSSRRS